MPAAFFVTVPVGEDFSPPLVEISIAFFIEHDYNNKSILRINFQ